MIRSHFAGGVSEQGDMQKGSFQRMVSGEKWIKYCCYLYNGTLTNDGKIAF